MREEQRMTDQHSNNNGWKIAAGYIAIGLGLGGLIGANQVQIARSDARLQSVLERMDRVREDSASISKQSEAQFAARITDLEKLITALKADTVARLDRIEAKINR
jgi:hypothetical protein